jgi:foldase protein PrsA
MMRAGLLFAAFLPALLNAQTVPTPPTVTPDRTLIVVNGEAVKGDVYVRRLQVLPNVGRMMESRYVSATPGYLAMQQIVNEILIWQLATEKGVAPTPAVVDAELAKRLARAPELKEAFRLLGLTEDDLKHEIKIELAEFALTTMGVNVTDQEVEGYYRAHPAQFSVPKRLVLRIIAVADEAAQRRVDGELAAGKSFADVARALSVDPSARDGGMLGEIPFDGLGDQAKAALNNAVKGSVSGWVPGSIVRVKFFVEDLKAAETLPLDADQKLAIRRQLMMDKGQVRNNLPKMLAEFRKKARIEWQNTPFDRQLKELFEQGA